MAFILSNPVFVSQFLVSGENCQFNFLLPEICSLSSLRTFVVENQFEVGIEHPHFKLDLAKTCTISAVGAFALFKEAKSINISPILLKSALVVYLSGFYTIQTGVRQ